MPRGERCERGGAGRAGERESGRERESDACPRPTTGEARVCSLVCGGRVSALYPQRTCTGAPRRARQNTACRRACVAPAATQGPRPLSPPSEPRPVSRPPLSPPSPLPLRCPTAPTPHRGPDRTVEQPIDSPVPIPAERLPAQQPVRRPTLQPAEQHRRLPRLPGHVHDMSETCPRVLDVRNRPRSGWEYDTNTSESRGKRRRRRVLSRASWSAQGAVCRL